MSKIFENNISKLFMLQTNIEQTRNYLKVEKEDTKLQTILQNELYNDRLDAAINCFVKMPFAISAGMLENLGKMSLKLIPAIVLSPLHLVQKLQGKELTSAYLSLSTVAIHALKVVAFAIFSIFSPFIGLFSYKSVIEFSKVLKIFDMSERSFWGGVGCKFGDTAGYMEGNVEFDYSTKHIHDLYWEKDHPKLLNELHTQTYNYSDDTVFCDMTHKVMKDKELLKQPTEKIVNALVDQYVRYDDDPKWKERGHGGSMMDSLNHLKEDPTQWPSMPFKDWKAGCGAAMRSMPIGEALAGQANREKLLEVALASSFATHTNPKGFLGGVATALFAAYAAEDKPFAEWLPELHKTVDQDNPLMMNAQKKLALLNKNENYDPNAAEPREKGWIDFQNSCFYYYTNRFDQEKNFHLGNFKDTPEDRDRFYINFTSVKDQPFPWDFSSLNLFNNIWPARSKWEISKECWPGAKGSEAPFMAYDALMLTISKFLEDNDLYAEHSMSTITPKIFRKLVQEAGPNAQEQVFKDLVERACLHGGDSDSTGAIAFYLQGAILKELAVPIRYAKNLEASQF